MWALILYANVSFMFMHLTEQGMTNLARRDILAGLKCVQTARVAEGL